MGAKSKSIGLRELAELIEKTRDETREELAERMANELRMFFELEEDVDEVLDFDEAVDLTEDNTQVVTKLYRFKNAIVIRREDDDSGLYILIMPTEEKASIVAERAKSIAEGFENIDFPVEFFYDYYSQDALYYEKFPWPPA